MYVKRISLDVKILNTEYDIPKPYCISGLLR